MSKKILIVSVHAPADHGREWYRLQRDFVYKNTTGDFDYKVILNAVETGGFLKEDILIVNKDNIGHSPALAQAIDYFRTSDHDACLLLDSDCFPIRNGWQDILVHQMDTWGKHLAAVIRTENLDLYPHPCAFFILREGLSDKSPDFQKGEAGNLLGEVFVDVGASMTGTYTAVFPLIRTNVVNAHPMAAGIYNHMFYHQHAASRNFNCRVIDRYYLHDHWYQRENQTEHAIAIQRKLFDDPEGFINYLCGHTEPTARRYIKGAPDGGLKNILKMFISPQISGRLSRK